MLLNCQDEYPNLQSDDKLVTNDKLFNLESGILDSNENTFRTIRVENGLKADPYDTKREQIRYYLTQVNSDIKVFIAADPQGEITSFEKDLI